MSEYKYRAALKNGQMIRGIITASNKTDALDKIKSNNLQTIYIKKLIRVSKEDLNRINSKARRRIYSPITLKNGEKSNKKEGNYQWGISSYFYPIKPKDVVVFSNNLYLLKKANFHNTQALSVLMETTENPIFKGIIEDIMIGVDSGATLNESMNYYPKIFPPLYTSIIKVGEETGDLTTALQQARIYIETSTALSKKIKRIVIPRILQFVGIFTMLIVGLLVGIPMIQGVYDMFGSKKTIPPATKVAVDVVNFLIQYWYVWVILFVGVGIAFYIFYSTPMGKYRIDKAKLKIPVFGRLFVNINTEKFFSALLLNLKSGVRVQESLTTAQGVIKNTYILAVIESAKANISAGDSWVKPFEDSGIFPRMTVEMLNVGMQTDIIEILEKVNEYTSSEVDESIDAMVKALPEITYLVVGIMIILFVLTVLLPIVDVYMGGFITET